MASPHRLLKDYQQLLSLSQKILHLAVSGQWDTLVEQEIVYVQSVEGLVNTPIPDEIDSMMRLHLRQILQEVMDNEAKVKQLLQKRMDELSSLMGQSLKQKSINTTYSEFAGHRLLPGEPLPDETHS
ncbi:MULTISPECIES: flagella biosynthesis regulatory protein FliT [Pectobacterium]|uniref:Flagellar protein FliT n=1 Tax=Pectobacterium parvum TaxID=2778550 RepID=A0AAP9LDF9_9GAMM|nr:MULTISPECIES: flagella biosynthesis regulatory protein FliT [Pectobacterium]KFX12552.1 flagellar biosynthesis protein FliT [Pectobacterium parvum]MCU1801206.1 flagella biosynthesis regulatory protein FliT [Pectobacterium parvum]QHQ25317.1 flagella biosynthesis regulatory protein FliT [Pectobacterium parvum]RUS02460.1 flagellar protein FliT [Pectobacterium polaris]